MDIPLPGKSGVEAVKVLKHRFPEVSMLLLSNFDDAAKVFYSLCFGASGYLLKSTPPTGLPEVIAGVHAGGTSMNPSGSRKILEQLRSGYKNHKVPPHDYQLSLRENEVQEWLV